MCYLPGGFHSLPDAEVDQNPDHHQTQHELPVELSGFVQTRRDVQNFVSAQRKRAVSIRNSTEPRTSLSSQRRTHSQNSMMGERASPSSEQVMLLLPTVMLAKLAFLHSW